ncbi:UDP-3-O-(3-hydroxymyristoyl)glucosamine N-acyltransferase [Pseudoalteromonas denitrificans]|uniref:UDP-3-O-acylglucosamine N-acyltransferase n=1 Tax=Pseudoalteromonas denitrificans DSM 6059 TaxID=1123010 RepID=A0A1I1HHE2_9GAMM|nr:UDP-3-O-(3-hydroxymyristoyl)glucosamine N-acyltransferase [Pseudoalteromonas denitrificans]SFC20893.1 UDP-3-O-[3-hydroxymyristoyl] glucosamine N-acyltransferase [Pseudoalteromonas denitrificans DSM 6059]
MQHFTLAYLAEYLGAELVFSEHEEDSNNANVLEITRIATLESAQSGQISFLANKKYRKQLETTQASAVILTQADAKYYTGNKLVLADPYVAYAKLAQLMDTTPKSASGIHSSAVIHADAIVSESASIGANAVIEVGAIIGDDCQIGPGCFIGRNAKLGSNCKIWANATIYHEVVLGDNCIIHANAVIGSDGFGFANEQGKWIKIPQLGSVVLGSNVEIGASTTVDRGALGDTEIHSNVIIDNQCQIAHNVVIGQGTAMAACSVIAGSSKIGQYCQIAGLCGINGHIEVCDKVILTGMAMVISSITEPGVYSSGIPHSKNRDWRKQMTHLRHIGDMNKKIKELEKLSASLVKVE